jgi:DNA-binding MarR family transcriptional regulator
VAPSWHLCSGRYQWCRCPGEEPDQSFDALGGGRQEELLSDELQPTQRILEMTQEQALSMSQIAACNRLHEAEERLARWLLMAQDRTQSEVLPFTQEFLAEMLGSQRTTVTVIAGALQRSGLIEYTRGHVRILNREELESAACDCYKIIRNLQNNLYKRAERPAELEVPSGRIAECRSLLSHSRFVT